MATGPDQPTDDGADSPSMSAKASQSLGKAGKVAADAAVDVAAIGAIAWLATQGVEAATLQAVGAMVVSVALGKRYMSRVKGA